MQTFDKILKNIKKLDEIDPQLSEKLKKYLYDIIGSCIEVHKDMGPYLNEYMYQEALDICLEEHGFTGENKKREHFFTTEFHGREIKHPHKVDFFINKKVFIECKAVDHLGPEQRQQLWNYMRLAKVRLGILYNFAPFHDECEKYYLDTDKQILYAF